jgi:xanthine dehydrogenase accessory factor
VGLSDGLWRSAAEADTHVMRDLLPTLTEWSEGDPLVAVATVVGTSGSTPRPMGARLLVSRDGRMAGSVSGGCLESAVVIEAQATIAGDAPPRLLHYGISDEMGWAVGLSCGGEVDIFVETLESDGSDPVIEEVRRAIETSRPVALLTVLDGDHAGDRAAATADGGLVGSLGGSSSAAEVIAAARPRIASGLPGVEEMSGTRVFVDPIVPAPQLIVIGAVHIAVALTTMARAAGFTVSVVDPRTAFNNVERIPDAERLVTAWPDEALPQLELGPRDAAVCLAHDPKFEDPALTSLLRTDTGYIGAIGSRGTHAKRVARLREAGFTDSEIARIHSPVGLNLGAATPEEIAIAILAEIVAVRRGRNAGSLSALAAAPVG